MVAGVNLSRFFPSHLYHIRQLTSIEIITKNLQTRTFSHISNMSRTGSYQDEKLQEVKEKFMTMSLEQKRNHYKSGGTYVTIDSVQTWQDYFLKSKERLQKQFFETYRNEMKEGSYSKNSDLNEKISLWQGNITQLEIDSIVNAANSRLLGGGGVDGAIHSAAGPSLKAECATLGGCEVGHAKMTGGYLLPAKYVIHTVGPQGENPERLESCYRTCLRLLTKSQLRTVAFPCISTGIYGYPQEAAAHVALKTVRNFMEKNPDLISRVIFCLFMPSDVKIYENLMQMYFPVEELKTNL